MRVVGKVSKPDVLELFLVPIIFLPPTNKLTGGAIMVLLKKNHPQLTRGAIRALLQNVTSPRHVVLIAVAHVSVGPVNYMPAKQNKYTKTYQRPYVNPFSKFNDHILALKNDHILDILK